MGRFTGVAPRTTLHYTPRNASCQTENILTESHPSRDLLFLIGADVNRWCAVVAPIHNPRTAVQIRSPFSLIYLTAMPNHTNPQNPLSAIHSIYHPPIPHAQFERLLELSRQPFRNNSFKILREPPYLLQYPPCCAFADSFYIINRFWQKLYLISFHHLSPNLLATS